MRHYNLGFISDELIFNHVKATMLQYCRKIDLKSFNKNIIDPVKLTFIYSGSMQISADFENETTKYSVVVNPSTKYYSGYDLRESIELK